MLQRCSYTRYVPTSSSLRLIWLNLAHLRSGHHEPSPAPSLPGPKDVTSLRTRSNAQSARQRAHALLLFPSRLPLSLRSQRSCSGTLTLRTFPFPPKPDQSSLNVAHSLPPRTILHLPNPPQPLLRGRLDSRRFRRDANLYSKCHGNRSDHEVVQRRFRFGQFG